MLFNHQPVQGCRRLVNVVHPAALLLAGLVVAGGGGCSPEPPDAPVRGDGHEAAKDEPVQLEVELRGEPAGHATPEDAVRGLLVGMLTRDEELVRASVLPDEKAEVLWAGEPGPPEQVERVRTMLREQVEIHTLEPGDRVALPGGEEHEIGEQVLTEDRQLVTAEREGRMMLAPVWVERTQAGWRVDAGPVIAAAMLRQLERQREQGEEEPGTPPQ